jgi:hypothetical protein
VVNDRNFFDILDGKLNFFGRVGVHRQAFVTVDNQNLRFFLRGQIHLVLRNCSEMEQLEEKDKPKNTSQKCDSTPT